MNEAKTRTEKITSNDWWLPLDCSKLSEEEKEKYKNHPLEQY